VVAKGRFAAVASIDQEIPIPHARDKLETRIVQVFLSGLEQFPAFFGRDMASREVLHRLVFDGHQIAADRPIVGAEFDALGGALERRASGVKNRRVIPQQAHRRHVGTGRQMRRHVARPTDDSGRRHRVHMGNVGRLQRGPAAQTFLRLIGTTIGNDNCKLHRTIANCEMQISNIKLTDSRFSLCFVP
jgi:hypothetical protein